MLASQNPDLKDHIIGAVIAGHNTATNIHKHLKDINVTYSLQAVYKAINQLIEGGVLVKYKTRIELSQEWVQQVTSMLEEGANIPSLSDGENVLYTFTSIRHHDAYWKHKVGSLKKTYEKYPVFSYEPHEIWIYLDERHKSQERFWANFAKKNRYGFIVIGSETKLDKKFKRDFTGDHLRINTDSSPQTDFNRTNYITVIEDYIIKTKLDAETSAEIDVLYKKNLNEHAHTKQLQNLLKNVSKISLKIERNKEKAKKVRKQLSRDFLISVDVKEKFNLFS